MVHCHKNFLFIPLLQYLQREKKGKGKREKEISKCVVGFMTPESVGGGVLAKGLEYNCLHSG